MASEKKVAAPLPPVTLTNEQALSIIGDFLTEEWTSLTPEDIIVTRLRGGYMNTLHKVERRDKENNREPNTAIIRTSGSERSGPHHDPAVREVIMKLTEAEEILIFHEMMKSKQCPRLIGLIEGGRVEEFRRMHNIKPKEVTMPEYMEDIAKAFARMHNLDLPLSKRKWAPFWQRAQDGYHKRPAALWIAKAAAETKTRCDAAEMNYSQEMTWINKILETHYNRRSRLGLIQADTHYQNLVVNEDPRPGELNVWLLDYELCSYGPRGLDLGAHFFNRQMDWSNSVDKSGSDMLLTGEQQHTHEERIKFLQFYQAELRRLNIPNFDDKGIDSIDNLLFESYVGALLYYLYFNYIAFFQFTEEDASRGPEGKRSLLKVLHSFITVYFEAKRRAIEQYPFIDPKEIM